LFQEKFAALGYADIIIFYQSKISLTILLSDKFDLITDKILWYQSGVVILKCHSERSEESGYQTVSIDFMLNLIYLSVHTD